VEPAPIVKIVMRPMTKILNPVIMRLAGRRHFHMAAQISHTGRRSGRIYVTPVGARLHGEVIVIPLTFGNQSDWSRNVAAAGGCSIRLDGRDYRATQPEFLSRDEARELIRPMYSPVMRAGFRMLGIRQFMRLHARPIENGLAPRVGLHRVVGVEIRSAPECRIGYWQIGRLPCSGRQRGLARW
jgi:deazaflavin-dependent oxidoreductase (nitroreductase family)